MICEILTCLNLAYYLAYLSFSQRRLLFNTKLTLLVVDMLQFRRVPIPSMYSLLFTKTTNKYKRKDNLFRSNLFFRFISRYIL